MTQATEPLHHLIDDGTMVQSVYEWRPELKSNGPTLMMVHATGFHARLWDEIIGFLPNYHVLAVDQRGHGQSTGGPVEHWASFGQDLKRLIEQLDLADILGIGHSMGAHALIDAAALCPGRFRQLIAVDPVIAEPAAYENGGDVHFTPDNPHPAAKRKNDFASVEEMKERFKERTPYSLFTPASFDNYCQYGLLPNNEGTGMILACPPAVEAAVYTNSRTNIGIFDAVKSLQIPVLIMRAKSAEGADRWDFTTSPTWPGLVDLFANGREIYRPDLTHFLPQQIPEELAGIIEDEIAGAS